MFTPPHTLVLGATGSIGYAITQALLKRQWPVTLLVRNRAKAQSLFAGTPGLTILDGDVQDAARVADAAACADFIVHAVNYPYHQWTGNMARATQHVIDAASRRPGAPATIVFPGNIYNFGLPDGPIRPDTPPAPITRKGQLRVELEATMTRAAEAGRCRLLTVRLPDFWGPNVLNAGIKPIFMAALAGKPMPWLIDADRPHQAVYTVDAAEVTVRLMARDWQTDAANQPATQVWHYGGTTLPSMRSWFGAIAQLTGHRPRLLVYPGWLFPVMGLVDPMMGEVAEMRYLYRNTVLLDDSLTRAALPDFQPTPMRQAQLDTITWFSQTQLGRPFVPALD